MRTSLIIFGIIFISLGVFLYLVPFQQINVGTTSGSDTRTSSANITVSVGWAYASIIFGFVLLILGVAIPGAVKNIQGPRGPRGKSAVRHKRSPKRRKSRRAILPRGTSVTTTTRIRR